MAQAYPQPKQGASITREEGGKVAPAGLYRHPNGAEQIVTEDPLYGNAQAQAFLRLGFEFVRPAEPGEIKSLPELHMEANRAEAESLKGLAARVGQLEGVADENTKLKAQIAAMEAEKAERDAKDAEDAAKAKEDQKAIEAAGKGNTALEESAKGAKENAKEVTKVREADKKEGK